MTNEQTNTKNQAPNPLPKTLPVGTRIIGTPAAATTAPTWDGTYYMARWSYEGGYLATSIDWSSVPQTWAKPAFALGMRVRHVDAGPGTLISFEGGPLDCWTVDFDDKAYGRTSNCHGKNLEPIEPEAAKAFDFGPFIRDDWDWLLEEARKVDPEAGVFLLSSNESQYLTAVSGYRTRAFSLGEVRAKSRDMANHGFGYERREKVIAARSERRLYPQDCPIARAKWGAKPVEESDEPSPLPLLLPRGLRVGSGEILSNRGQLKSGTRLYECPRVNTTSDIDASNINWAHWRELCSKCDHEFALIALTRNACRKCGVEHSPAGVGSVKPLVAAAAREPASAPELALAEATRYCAECGASSLAKPNDYGLILCALCLSRRANVAQTGQQRQPCGYGCRCVYCRYSCGEGILDRATIDASYRHDTDNPKLGPARLSLAACRERLAAVAILEARERRSNDPTPATRKMLEGARDALRHWPSVEEWEP